MTTTDDGLTDETPPPSTTSSTPALFRGKYPSIAAIPCVDDLLKAFSAEMVKVAVMDQFRKDQVARLFERIESAERERDAFRSNHEPVGPIGALNAREIAELVELGGRTDGAHHKQWALSQIGALVGVLLPDPGVSP